MFEDHIAHRAGVPQRMIVDVHAQIHGAAIDTPQRGVNDRMGTLSVFGENRPRLICYALVLACWSFWGQGADLVANGDFELGLDGWEPRPLAGGAKTACAVDTSTKHTGGAALRVPGNSEKAGVHQVVTMDLSACRVLEVSYCGRARAAFQR